MKANKLVMAVGCLMALGSVARAAVPTVPTAQFYGTINGKTSIWVKDTDGVTNYWFQAKGLSEDDSAWRTVDFELLEKSLTESKAFPDSLIFRRPADFSGVVCFRVANTNALGESAGWLTFGGATNFLRHVGKAFGCTGNAPQTTVFDGEVSSYYESNPKYAGTQTPWVGLKFDAPVTVSRIRFAPRLSDLGWLRLTGDVFQCADDAEFTNPVTIGTVPEAKNITGVSEIVLDRPVTARYFRVLHLHVRDEYIAIAEMELVAEGLTVLPELKVSCSDDYTNQYAKIDWQIPEGVQCPSGIVQRSVSPAGPFADIGEWTAAGVRGFLIDRSAALAVPYYYRLRQVCEVPYLAKEQYSGLVRYARGRRLDRNWGDEATLRPDVSLVHPFIHLGTKSAVMLVTVRLAFDGITGSQPPDLCHFTGNDNIHKNPAIGLDLGSPHHVTGSLILPWDTPYDTNRWRDQRIAVYGADAEDLSDARQLTPTNGYFATIDWVSNHVTNENEVCRYVYFQTPTPETFAWYGNVDEVRFFGFSDQDTLDAGVTIPPMDVSVAGVAGRAEISWGMTFNAETLVVERRLADGDWLEIAALGGDARVFVDYGAPAETALDYRVVAYGEGDVFAYSPSVRATLPQGGDPFVDGLSVKMSDWTNQTPLVSWSADFGLLFPSSTVQRAVSPHGPFADVSPWVMRGSDGSFVDESIAVGVPYYYRLKVACDDPLATASEFVGEPIVYRRSKRLDRNWDDLTTMRTGVSVMYPYEYLGSKSTVAQNQAKNCFDGKADTICHQDVYTNGVRVMNPAVGVDLGAIHHITAALVLPWNTPAQSNRDRVSRIAVYGADTSDLLGSRQLTPTNGFFATIDWIYNSVTNVNDECRYVYYQTPTPATFNWYGNAAEFGFFGWCEQDIVDSGVLVPPTEIAVTPDTAEMTVSWNAGYNVASYLVQRRVAGTEAWTDVVTLPPSATSCADGARLKKGGYEYRVLATGTDGTTGLTAVVGCDFEPKRGMILIFR